MLLSAVTPLPGVTPQRAAQVLSTQALSLLNLGGSDADSRLGSYHQWTTETSRMLASVFPLEEVEALVMTQRHNVLVARQTGYNQPLIHGLIDGEQADRSAAFTKLAGELEALHQHCTRMPPQVLVPDTNIYLHNEKPFAEIDWTRDTESTRAIRLLIPMTVIRELDSAKRSTSGKKVSPTNAEPVRDRARTTSRRFRELFVDPQEVVTLAQDVTAELLLDPVGHQRLPDPDSEIIDRALAAQTLSTLRVSVVTDDGNMQFSAKVAGLGVVTLHDPLNDS